MLILFPDLGSKVMSLPWNLHLALTAGNRCQ